VALSDRLEGTHSSRRPGLPCRLGSLLRGDTLDHKDKDYLIKVLDIPLGDPTRIPTTAIAEALKQEGHNMGVAAVTRHRRKECRCYGISPKYSKD
jgi:hypothetical protein